MRKMKKMLLHGWKIQKKSRAAAFFLHFTLHFSIFFVPLTPNFVLN